MIHQSRPTQAYICHAQDQHGHDNIQHVSWAWIIHDALRTTENVSQAVILA